MAGLLAEQSVERKAAGTALAPVFPQLKEIVAEASVALAHLDANRLEELALSCEALNRGLSGAGRKEWEQLAVESKGAAEEMAVLARVLEATKANLNVMHRLRELRLGQEDYGSSLPVWKQGTESRHGDN